MTTCMNGVTRLLLSLVRGPRTHLSGAKARDLKWEAKTPWNFTIAWCCDIVFDVQHRWELFEGLDASLNLDKGEIPPVRICITNFLRKKQRQVGSLAGAAPC